MGEERIANELKFEAYDSGLAAHGGQVPAQGQTGAYA